MGLSEELKLAIEKYVSENKVVLFMKGNRQFPQCGFSNTCVQILNTLNVPYETVNILEDERLRSGMKVRALPGARRPSSTARTSAAWPAGECGAPRALRSTRSGRRSPRSTSAESSTAAVTS